MPLLIVVAYVISGVLSLMLALPPGYASAIFPPAGIAVAAAFIGGSRTLPWIFSGSLLLNLWIGYSSSHQINGINLTAALVIAAASMLQAAAGGWLLRRVIGYPAAFDNVRAVFGFLLLAPVICLTSATLSITGLVSLGVFDAGSLAVNWLTWWVGDSLGVIVTLPLVLILAGAPRQLWRSRRLTVAAPMLLMFGLIVAMFIKTNAWERDNVLTEFRMVSAQSLNQVQSKLDEQTTLLLALNNYILNAAGEPATRREFRHFTEDMLSRFPMIQAMEWVPYVGAQGRARFVERQRREMPDFEIRELDPHGKLQRAGEREEFYPVTYVEPVDNNKPAIGFDLASNARRLAAIRQTFATGQVVATAPVMLVQGKEQPGLLLIKGVVADGKEVGVVLVVLKMHDFINKILPPLSARMNVRLVDDEANSVLYDNQAEGAYPQPLFEQAIDFGGRHYTMQATPTSAYLKAHRGWASWAVLAAGTAGTGLLGGLLLLGTGFTYRMQRQVEERTAQLLQGEQQLRLAYQELEDKTDRLAAENEKNLALLHNASDGIHILDAGGNIIEASDSFCAMLGYTREEVLGMNVAQWDAGFTSVEEMMAKIREQFGRKERSLFETRHRRKDGTIIDVEVSGFPLKLGGKPVLFNSSRDITARKQSEAALRDSEQRLLEILNLSPIAVRLAVSKGREVLFCNAAYTELIKNTLALGDDPRRYYARAEDYDEILAELESGKIIISREVELQIPGGGTVWVLGSYMPIKYRGMEAVLGWFYDITERKLYAARLQQSEKEYRHLIELLPYGVLIHRQGQILLANNAAAVLLQAERADDLVGQPIMKFVHAEYHDVVSKRIRAAIDQGENQDVIEEQLVRLDGSAFFAEVAAISVLFENHPASLAVFMDISDKKKKEELIWTHANFDALTGLPNRRLFLDRLEQEAKRMERADSSLALLFIDLDRFKEVNDTLGHAKGDMLLIEATRRIRRHVRSTDTFARLGGDEFTLILPDFEEPANIDRIVQNILRELDQPFDLGAGDVGHISGSVGITLYPEDAANIDELLQHADQAMYAAKAAGRNGFSYFTLRMQIEAQEKLALTNDLRRALADNQLTVVFQPIFEVSSGKIAKAEALLRWHHPTRGLITPASFIPLAEESGLILEIGEWVFIEALRNIAAWKDRTGALIQVCVNKSPVQFTRAVEHPWLEMLALSGLPAKCITVEITEGLLLTDSRKVRDELDDFQKRGIEVSIDDFGTGFSALSYLNKFDIDYLKIDKSFVRDLSESESSRTLVEAIIIMAHKLGIRTIAEGVETAGQRDLLIGLGCDYMQGYLYSRPVAPDEFEQMLAEQQGRAA